jgi:hypothetical protein
VLDVSAEYKTMKPEATSVLSFIAQVISSLAWPATVLTCIFLLGRHLLALIPLVRTVKYSDVEIRFGQEIAELKRTTEIAELKGGGADLKHDRWESLSRLVDVRPRTAIRMAWNQIDNSIRELAKRKDVGITDAAEGMPMVIGALLLNQGVISTQQYQLMQNLRMLYHQAERAEADTITADSAAEYVGLALRLAASLEEKGP